MSFNVLLLSASLFAVAASANSVGNLINLGNLDFNVYLYNLGHQCSSFSLSAFEWQTWNTPGFGSCEVNVDTIVIALNGNPNLNCSVIVTGGYQLDPVSGFDINMGTNILVGTAGIDLCVTANAIGVPPPSGYQVKTHTTCGACSPAAVAPSVSVKSQSRGSPVQGGAFEVTTSTQLTYAMYASEMTACNTVQTQYNNPYSLSSWSAGRSGDSCTAPLSAISFSGPNLRSCVANFTSTAVTTSFVGVLGVTNGDICLTGKIASPNENLLLTDCPVCKP